MLGDLDKIEINNPFRKEIEDDFIRQALSWAINKLRETGMIVSGRMEISVALVGEEEMAKLNKLYRKKESSTDVLSFCYNENKDEIEGEIVLSPKVIKCYAREDKKEFKAEFKKNLIHGLLHILGMKHGKKMFSWQEKLSK